MSTIKPGSIILLGIAMLIAGVAAYFIPVVIDGFDEARVGQATTSESDSVVLLNATVGNVTLDETLIDTSTKWITSVSATSTNGTSTPVADNISGQTLYLTGLSGNATNTVLTTYRYNPLAHFTLTTTILQLGPGIIILGFVIAVGITGFLGFKGITKG